MALRDEQINDYFNTMNEVEANLEEIKKHEGIITTQLSGEGSNQKDNIVSSINALNDLIQKNKKLVADLDKKYKMPTSRSRSWISRSLCSMSRSQLRKQNWLT